LRIFLNAFPGFFAALRGYFGFIQSFKGLFFGGAVCEYLDFFYGYQTSLHERFEKKNGDSFREKTKKSFFPPGRMIGCT